MALCLGCACAAFAQSPYQIGETWSDGNTGGWTNNAQKTALESSGGVLTVRHPTQSGPPFYVGDTIRHALPATVVPTEMIFTVHAADTAPSELRACVHAAGSGHLWYRPLTPPAAGERKQYTVPIRFSDGWLMGPNSSKTMFEADVAGVDWVGVYISRSGDTKEQEYDLDSFLLRGSIPDGDLDRDGLPNAWEVGHGLDAADRQDASNDRDGDGSSNYGEYRAGTDPTNALSVFELRISRRGFSNEAEPVVISWQSASNRTYAVLRSRSPLSDFTRVDTVPASPPENRYRDGTATQGETYFYRVRVEKP